MPIIQINQSFQDMFGTTRSFLQSNAGDLQTARISIRESISVNSSLGESIQNNPALNLMTWLGGNWEEEGFRVGDTITITTYTESTGVVLATTSTTIVWINEDEMEVASALSSWYTQSNGEAVSIFNTRNREQMTLEFNMVVNGSAGSQYSLIDGEVSRFTFDLSGGAGATGVQIGNKSGAYDLSAVMVLNSTSGSTKEYELQISFQQSGLYNSNLFSFDNCLKLYARMSWSSLLGEPFGQTESIFNEDADSGWFNEAFNTGSIDATLVQGISELGYDQATSGQFVIDSASNDYAIGSAYISNDDSYFKIQPESQSNLTMIVPSSLPISGVANQSALNPDGAGYTIELTNIATAGTIRTIDFTFTPNGAFTTFMEAQTEGNKTFYVWMKFGSVNVLVFSGQLTKQPVTAGPITMVVSQFFDHSQQQTDGSLVQSGYTGNVEDDFGWIGKWRWVKKALVTYVRVGVQAYNSSTGASFTLQQNNFSLNNVPQETTGLEAYILDETQAVNSTLPTTSVKRQIRLKRDTSLDQAIEYGVSLYFPYLYRWEYWLQLMNVSPDFYPDEQTRNWVPYGNTGNWGLRLFVEYDMNGLAYQYYDDIIIKDYDSAGNIQQDIQLFRADPLQNVQVIIEGEQMRIVATNTNLNGDSWVPDSTWGMITIEPTESSPRWISSSAIDFDGNTLNPLTPLSGLRCDLTFPSPDVARLECKFDPSKIDLSAGVKITAKIKGCHWT